MPRYLVNKATMVCHTGRQHQPGEIVTIDWPVDKHGTSLAPTRLDQNLELLPDEDGEEEVPRGGGGARRRATAAA